MTSISRKFLLGTGVLALSATAAAAVPAVVRSDLNLRSGPGTQYEIVGSLPGGATVDVGNCSGRWCTVSYGGEQGYAARSYLDLGAAGAPVEPDYGPTYSYVEPDYYYGDDYYYGYGPGITFGYGFDRRRHWHGRRDGHWRSRGRPGFYGPAQSDANAGVQIDRRPRFGSPTSDGSARQRFTGSAPARGSFGPRVGGSATVGAGAPVQRSAPSPSMGGGGGMSGGAAPSGGGAATTVRPGFGRQ